MTGSSSGFVAPPVARVAASTLAGLDPDYPALRGDRPVSRTEQAARLARIVELAGPAGLLTAGRRLAMEPAQPIVLVLLNSASIDVMLDKVDRLNRFLHSHHRQRVLDRAPGRRVLQHVSLTRTPPEPHENLFVAGLMAALTAAVGATGVSIAFPASPNPGVVMVDGAVCGAVPEEGTDVWDIRWETFVSRPALPGLDEIMADLLGPDLELPAMTARVRAVLATDLARRWTVAELAAAVAVSPRTLQRRLRAESTSFNEQVARVRIEAARRLLGDAAVSITEIGYRCGYADTAHFSRSFRAATGLSPSEWRARRSRS